ncbi:MAG: 2-oxoacid:acceptor oxidoreductase subunit alpha [Candidatus Hadarchaeum sp.]|uniref:2-oxoacid:acceptor oxidoreductase subunit alpha n=1 Tax=Candidatus Hadarchaeum sp. TaxID=2883567 RepID=UPI003173BD62
MTDVSLLVGGQAGDGVMRTAELIGRIFNRMGLYVFVINDYGSLIRGGHNFCKIRISERQLWLHRESIDLIAAVNQDTIAKHEKELVDGGRILYDSDVSQYKGSHESLPIPLTDMVKQAGGSPIMRNSVLIGAIAYLYGIPPSLANDILMQAYGDKATKNIELARAGYDYAEKNFEKILTIKPISREQTPFISGAEAVALGAVKAGMKLYVTYPMTPSTAILNYIGPNQESLGVVLVHPENEIGAANMALGAAYAGVRTMVGTAGGGFALMQEAFSMAGQAEIPVVFVVGQRVAPAVGAPTYTAQADLKFAVGAGHGEFPRIVVAPGDPEEAFIKTGEAINLAWKYQSPAIVLVDKHLLESYMSIYIEENKVKVEPAEIAEEDSGDYRRYRFTESGISPLAFPGWAGKVVKVTSYEHNEYGYAEESPEGIQKMQEKRMRKLSSLIQDLKERETVKIYGDTSAENLVVAWGSTKGAVLEVMELIKKPLKFIQVLYLSPFPGWEINKHLKLAKKVLLVEGNMTGQLGSLIAEHTGFRIENTVLKNDGRPFDQILLAERIKEAFGWR